MVSLRPAIYLLLFIAVFAGFQGGRYFLANRLQELGIAAAMGVLGIAGFVALFRLDYATWRRTLMAPVLLIGAIMVIWAAVFAVKYDGSFKYSFFSSREFLLGCIGPAFFAAGVSGVSIQSLRRVIWLALVALAINYLAFWSTMDLRAAFFSADHTVSNLVTYDEWRGFRLKPPLFAIMILLTASLFLVVQRCGMTRRVAALCLVALCGFIWSIVMFRSTLATLLLSMTMYPMFLRDPGRLRWAVLVLPLLVATAPPAVQAVLDHFQNADGGSLRIRAMAVAWNNIPQHLILGVGEDSAYGQTYQDLFAYYFYPSDIGLTGVLFKYGLIGLALYLYMHGFIWYRLWSTHWKVGERDGRHDPLLFGMLMFMTAQTMNLALNPGLALAQGITAGSLALGLAALHRHRLALQSPVSSNSWHNTEVPGPG